MGGVGQTSLVLSIAQALRDEGHRVAVVDLDLQGTSPNLADLVEALKTDATPAARLPDFALEHGKGLDIFVGPTDATEIRPTSDLRPPTSDLRPESNRIGALTAGFC